MTKDTTPTFVRFFISLFPVILLGLFVLPTESPCSTDRGSNQDCSSLSIERQHRQGIPDRPAKPTRKVIVIQQGDHFSGILEKEGLSPKDSLYVARKADKVFRLNKMRPNSQLELYFTHDGTGLQEVDYKISNLKRVVLYNGRVIEKTVRSASTGPASPSRHSTTAPRREVEGPRITIPKKTTQATMTAEAPRLSPQTAKTPAGTARPTFREDGNGLYMVASYNPGLSNTPYPYQEPYELLSDGKVPSPVMLPWSTGVHSDRVVKSGTRSSRNLSKSNARMASRKDRPGKKTKLARNTGERKRLEDGFLKAPLNYRYISSGYTCNRIHPITNTALPHYGIDYAAPRGTPVHAIGTGTVIYAGWDGGFGKTIRIRHKNGYVSHYGHLSRYAKGIRAGKKINKGDTIGFVGMTGTATGPHLDFRVTYHGNFINPESLDRHFKRISGHAARRTQG